MNIFEIASRKKVRFPTPQGNLSVEELWELPLTSKTNKANLDDIAKELYAQVQDQGKTVSFVMKTTEVQNSTLMLQFDIVRHIIDVRLEENKAASQARENAEKKQRLLSLIAQKEDAALAETSLDELKKMVEAL